MWFNLVSIYEKLRVQTLLWRDNQSLPAQKEVDSRKIQDFIITHYRYQKNALKIIRYGTSAGCGTPNSPVQCTVEVGQCVAAFPGASPSASRTPGIASVNS